MLAEHLLHILIGFSDTVLAGQFLGRLLGVPVKNAGASYSGPHSYVAYLKHFGAAPGARHALMVFFEGNDLFDVEREAQWAQLFEITGKREYRDFIKQSSFLKAGYRFLSRLVKGDFQQDRLYRNAYFQAIDGEVAVSVNYTPPGSEEVRLGTQYYLDRALAGWAETADTLSDATISSTLRRDAALSMWCERLISKAIGIQAFG